MNDSDRKSAEETLAKFLTLHFMRVDVDIEEVYLDRNSVLRVKIDTGSPGAKEHAYNAIRALKRLGVVEADNSALDEDGLLPENIELQLKSDAMPAISKWIAEEPEAFLKKEERRVTSFADLFEDNRLDFEASASTSRVKAIAALCSHFASVTNLVFDTSDYQTKKNNPAKVEFVDTPAGEFLGRPKFVVTYGRNTRMAFGDDNEVLGGLRMCFERSSNIPGKTVRYSHDSDDTIGTITVTGNPLRLLNDVRGRVFARNPG